MYTKKNSRKEKCILIFSSTYPSFIQQILKESIAYQSLCLALGYNSEHDTVPAIKGFPVEKMARKHMTQVASAVMKLNLCCFGNIEEGLTIPDCGEGGKFKLF
jgi:hypothetical protein